MLAQVGPSPNSVDLQGEPTSNDELNISNNSATNGDSSAEENSSSGNSDSENAANFLLDHATCAMQSNSGCSNGNGIASNQSPIDVESSDGESSSSSSSSPSSEASSNSDDTDPTWVEGDVVVTPRLGKGKKSKEKTERLEKMPNLKWIFKAINRKKSNVKRQLLHHLGHFISILMNLKKMNASAFSKKVNVAYTLVGIDVNYHIYDEFVKKASSLAPSTIRNRFNFMLNLLDILVEVTPNSSVCNQLEARKTFWRKIFKEWNLVAGPFSTKSQHDQASHDEDKSMDQ